MEILTSDPSDMAALAARLEGTLRDTSTLTEPGPTRLSATTTSLAGMDRRPAPHADTPCVPFGVLAARHGRVVLR